MEFLNLTQEQYSLILDEWKYTESEYDLVGSQIPLYFNANNDTVEIVWEMVNDNVRIFFKSIGLDENMPL
jgi:hypothetical protein